VAEIGAYGRTFQQAATASSIGVQGTLRIRMDTRVSLRCEEVKERDSGVSPTTRELGRRQWRGGRRSNSVTIAARAREGVGAWECANGGAEVPWGRLYRLKIEGEGGFPADMAINGRGLEGELRGRGIMEGNGRLKKGNEGRASLRA
jgi:hypothetical protein